MSSNIDTEDYVKAVQNLRAETRRMGITFASVDDEDIYQSGYVALLECEKDFDPSKGASFVTFAAQRVRWAIHDFLRRQSMVPIPEHDYRRGVRYNRIVVDTPEQEEYIIAEIGMTDKSYRKTENREALDFALNAIPSKEAAILKATMLDETFQAIADRYQYSRQYTHRLYLSGLEHARKVLETCPV